jgi:hypothetical protein
MISASLAFFLALSCVARAELQAQEGEARSELELFEEEPESVSTTLQPALGVRVMKISKAGREAIDQRAFTLGIEHRWDWVLAEVAVDLSALIAIPTASGTKENSVFLGDLSAFARWMPSALDLGAGGWIRGALAQSDRFATISTPLLAVGYTIPMGGRDGLRLELQGFPSASGSATRVSAGSSSSFVGRLGAQYKTSLGSTDLSLDLHALRMRSSRLQDADEVGLGLGIRL